MCDRRQKNLCRNQNAAQSKFQYLSFLCAGTGTFSSRLQYTVTCKLQNRFERDHSLSIEEEKVKSWWEEIKMRYLNAIPRYLLKTKNHLFSYWFNQKRVGWLHDYWSKRLSRIFLRLDRHTRNRFDLSIFYRLLAHGNTTWNNIHIAYLTLQWKQGDRKRVLLVLDAFVRYLYSLK